MKRIRRLPVAALCLLALLLAPALRGDETTTPQHPLDRVTILGASATAGFGLVLRYQGDEFIKVLPVSATEIVEAVMTKPDVAITGEGNGFFYMSPVPTGRRQVKEALDNQPTLVLAVDFLFWYGYGNRDAMGQPFPRGPKGRNARLALLELGLEQLDSFTCPIVVGDFPDASDAVGHMLSPSQVPAPGTLQALNKRLREWAASRPNVMILHVSTLIDRMRSNEEFTAGRQQWPKGARSQFMQNDNLHPTLDGLIILVQEAGDHLARHSAQVDESHFDFSLESVRNRIYESRKPPGTTAKPYTDRP